MQVKIDTKEKFHVITIREKEISANMTEELNTLLLTFLESPIRSIVLNMEDIRRIDDNAAESLILIQQRFYEFNSSFVACNITDELTAQLEKISLLEMLNAVPTESEAYDIVQIEEIEREYMEDENP
jgi:anti-anti-sigma regulatory factor